MSYRHTAPPQRRPLDTPVRTGGGGGGEPGPAGPQGPAGADGADGATGATGPAGPGVAAGGTTGQHLQKTSGVDYATGWITVPAPPTTLPPSGAAGGDLAGTYPNPDIKALAVGTPELAAGAVTDAKVTDVAWGKVTGAPASFPPSGAASGDLTGTYPAPQLAAGVIVNADVNAAAAIQGTKLADAPNGVPTAKLNDLAVTDAKIAGVAYAKVTGAPTSLPPSGSAGGSLSGSYPNPGIAAGVVTPAQLDRFYIETDDTYTGGDLTGQIVNGTIAAGKVTAAKLSPAPVAGDVGKMVTVGAGPALAYTAVPTTLPPSGTAGGDLSGTYPNPQLAAGAIVDADVSATAAIQYSKLTGTPTTLPPSGAASGDLTGTYPGPTIAKLNGATVGTTTPVARGDLLVANATPALARLGLGANGTVLQSNGTDALWAAPISGPPSGTAGGDLAGTYPNPAVDGINGAAVGVTTPLARGDVLVANATPALVRLAKGTTGQVLQATATDVVWGTPVGGPPTGTASGDLSASYPGPTVAKVNGAALGTTTPLARGDILVANATPALARLGKGTTGQVLAATATDAVWQSLTQAQLPVAPSGITTANINDGAVTFVKRGEAAQARIRRSTAQTITANTETAISFDTIVTNVGSLYSAGTPDRFTIQQAGFYLIGGQVSYDTVATATYRILHISVNSLSEYTTAWADSNQTAALSFNISGALQLAAGAIVYLVAYHSATASLAAADGFFWIVRVG